jgi:predicted transcriptional regulator
MSIVLAVDAMSMDGGVEMAIPKSVVTDAELEVLKALWVKQPVSAREIAEQLYEEATTSSIGTVQKLISRLEEKGLVHRDRRETVHRFSAAVTREEVAGMQLDEFASKLSGGSLSPFVLHLVQAKRLSAKEKREIKRLLDE